MEPGLELIRGRQNLSARHRGGVVTIGNFDGVHRGHQELIARARELAAGAPVTVLTFEPTPREFFTPQSAPPRISTLRGKLAALAAAGADRVLLQRFGHPFCELTPDAFVRELLVRQLGATAVVVGDDFRFGAKRAGDFALLRQLGQQHGFAAEQLATLVVKGERCSSSALREALAAADL
ncbi:MAG TPA: adenylyltransferase/cytidyltransferase family protein, partial [Nevskiaceae bacterium]|nr:adenylyltransferase/cytidyltransferase family protein [Nevskiaceae bacterium]